MNTLAQLMPPPGTEGALWITVFGTLFVVSCVGLLIEIFRK
jgi:hypothetical protein